MTQVEKILNYLKENREITSLGHINLYILPN